MFMAYYVIHFGCFRAIIQNNLELSSDFIAVLLFKVILGRLSHLDCLFVAKQTYFSHFALNFSLISWFYFLVIVTILLFFFGRFGSDTFKLFLLFHCNKKY